MTNSQDREKLGKQKKKQKQKKPASPLSQSIGQKYERRLAR
jgi:hypothetical protein